jgi:predicted transcriptional regulator
MISDLNHLSSVFSTVSFPIGYGCKYCSRFGCRRDMRGRRGKEKGMNDTEIKTWI